MHFYEVWPRLITHGENHELTYHAETKMEVGQLAKIEVGRKTTIGLIIREVKPPKFKTKPLVSLNLPPLPAALIKTIEWMSDYYATPLPLVLNNALPRGLDKNRRSSAPTSMPATRRLANLDLSSQQKSALKQLLSSPSTAILKGDTGSGKTLIYRELIKHHLSAGRSALLLVPEIGLTPQALSDYADLTEHIYVTHSGLSESERHKIWLNILQQKSPKFVLGPRSALFAPIDNLGVVIIDESHEPSYKQDVSPKYNTQTVAAYLTQAHTSQLVLGSATPRIQDIFVSQKRHQPVVSLPPHFARQTQPVLVDRTRSDMFTKHAHLSSPLLDAIENTLAQGRQSMVYLNRRGSAQLVLCNECGWSATCPRCDLGLTLHHDQHLLRCHQCGYTDKVPSQCPVCQNTDIRFRGVGTKRIAADLAKLFPQAKIERFDSDSSKSESLTARYSQLLSGQIDIVVGTQAIARSLDLPLLDTVGVVSADSELLLPDFSAAERTFQLLYQVIGRVGRTSGNGSVIVQTHNPEHPAITYALNHDYDGFYAHELQHREQFGYPPFRHLLGLVVSYSTRQRAESAASAMANKLRRQSGLTVLGPTPCFYERQGNRYRWLVVVKSSSRPALLELARSVRSQSAWQIDIDPSNLLF